jgi:hypothetical protein
MAAEPQPSMHGQPTQQGFTRKGYAMSEWFMLGWEYGAGDGWWWVLIGRGASLLMRQRIMPVNEKNSLIYLNCQAGYYEDFIGSTPRSRHILLARKSLISVCLGIAERLLDKGFCHHE